MDSLSGEVGRETDGVVAGGVLQGGAEDRLQLRRLRSVCIRFDRGRIDHAAGK